MRENQVRPPGVCEECWNNGARVELPGVRSVHEILYCEHELSLAVWCASLGRWEQCF